MNAAEYLIFVERLRAEQRRRRAMIFKIILPGFILLVTILGIVQVSRVKARQGLMQEQAEYYQGETQ